MEDKDKNVSQNKGKTVWKKSNFRKETGEKCKKNIRFNLNVDVHSDGGNDSSSPTRDSKIRNGGPSPKKRKKDLDMPNIPNEIEREIEMQYHSKAKETKLTTRNVKTILKSVITNKYVVDMVRAVEEGGCSDLPFEPKLTRAKTKELLQQHPEVPALPVVGLLPPVIPSKAELSPEIKLLIDKELPEDSSDEEYNPENDPEPSDDEEKGDTSLASDLDSLPPTPASVPAPPTPVHEASLDWSQDGVFKVPQENVGQRTRSKLDFHNLPLECIEQAYVPPDITPDMYEAECDNPDWHEFLKEFTQPLVPNETLDDDPENDPEYNILEDEEKDPVDYKEEMRKDKAVKVSKKELKALMKELFETDSLSSDEDDARTSESIAELEASIMKETEERQRREEEEKKKKQVGFHPNQRLLLAQQLRQHVQLTTQHFLQTYRHPVYHHHAGACKTMLVTIGGLKNDNICCQGAHNLDAALQTVGKWEEIHDKPQIGDKIRGFVAEQIKAESALKKNKRKMVQMFPSEMMSLVTESEAFLFPMLLPPIPFLTSGKPVGPFFFTPSEDMLLAICLEQVTQLMEDNPGVYKRRNLIDVCRVIYETSFPRSSPRSIAAHIRKLKGSQTMNPIKAFFENGKPPVVCHYVIPIQPGIKLFQQPTQLLPEVWRSFTAITYNEKEAVLKEGSERISSDQENPPTKSKIEKKKNSELKGKRKGILKSHPNSKDIKQQIILEKKKGENEIGKVPKRFGDVTDLKVISKSIDKETTYKVQGANLNKPMSTSMLEKPKTTQKDIRSMLAKANSIQQAVKCNGQVSLIDQSKNIESKHVSQSQSKAKQVTKSKTETKGSTNQKLVKSTTQSCNTVSGSTKLKSTPKKQMKSKLQLNKKSKSADQKSTSVNPIISVVPKIKFNVVPKTTTCHLKSENKQKGKSRVIVSDTANSTERLNQKEYLNSLKLLPNNEGCQENSLLNPACKEQSTIPQADIYRFDSPNSCRPTSISTKQSNAYNCLGPQIHSESDSHQSNSIESERTPLCVNIINSHASSLSHSPRPPSTVKLKDTLNFYQVVIK